MAYAAVCSKVLVLLLFTYCFMYPLLILVVLCSSLFWYALLYALSSFTIILTRTRELVALLLLFFRSHVTVRALPHGAVGCLQFVIVVFYNHTHLLFLQNCEFIMSSPTTLVHLS